MIRIRQQVVAVFILLLLLSASCTKPASPAPQSSSASAVASVPVDPTTVASISGVVQFSGKVPPSQKIDMSADSGCKGQNQSEAILAEDGHLANVLVYVKDGLDGRTFPS